MGRSSKETASASRSADDDPFSLSATLDQYEVKEVTPAQAATLLEKPKRRRSTESRPAMERETEKTDSIREHILGNSLDWLFYSRQFRSYFRRK